MATPSSDASTADKHPNKPSIAPQIYVSAHKLQRAINIETLDLLHESFGSRPNSSQQFIDVGCGTGDFTHQDLLPRCQPCRRIVATDLSRKMVEYAKENFAHPQISYEVHDIESDVSGLVEKYGKFDRVYSFFALQWAGDLTAALRNVADLMTDEGECLLLFGARLTLHKVWRRIMQVDRWKPYKEVLERFIPPSHDMEDISGLISYMLRVLENANLKPRTCQVLSQDRHGSDPNEFIKLELSLDPVLPLLPEESKAQFKTDVADIINKMWTEKPAGDPQLVTDMFVVHASKI
ncbi:juvenile hormone acid O-methyltransferase [Ixodes scapularis]|uniref:juvenile hormone acid O-methyltransferase n=1 Tax=Ixodes scapularis TaxID=6945 RepID=UPI0011617E03|nr:juvenile hormone acid O-methyltransferase [Ixodes scapularis]